MRKCTLYVIKCRTPGKWYVGTTIRPVHVRIAEHRIGYACKWTRRHGFSKVYCTFEVPNHLASKYENDVWMFLARQHGPENVRGGDVTIVQRMSDAIPDYLLPMEFGGTRVCDWGIV